MLFNKRLLQNEIYKFELPVNYNYERTKSLINNWQSAIRQGNYDKTKETQLQVGFLDAFFYGVLGYSRIQDGNDEWNLINEAKTEFDETRADGALGYFYKDTAQNITRAVIELKDAKTNLDNKQSARKGNYTPIEQAFGYVTKNDRCDWIIVSNFKEIRLYNKERGQGFYEKFEILELNNEKEFKRFYFCLCKQNLLDKNRRSPLDLLVIDTTRNEEEITKAFYKDFKTLRVDLFNHIKEHNPSIDPKILLEKTQKLLDRMVFIFFCEDTNNLLPHGIVKKVYNLGLESRERSDQRIWREFRNLFMDIDEGRHDVLPPINAYNGGLFKPDEILEKLNIKDDIWEKIVKISDYDFESDLNVNILGHIFEQSLSDIEQLKAELDRIEQYKSKRKKDGIFYTPEYITRYIVEQTVGKYLEENPDKLETIKILDPACGSGAFLNQAHSFLKQEYQNRNVEKLLLARNNETLNIFEHINIAETDRSILLNNLYGVDLNEESTEITKLALWLKTAHRDYPLQDLSENIKCGNSLIDDSEIAGDKAFKWNKEFKEIMDNGGFDVIIGNPPYVFTRGQEYSENLKKYFDNYLVRNNIFQEKKGKNIQSGKLNLYSWFILKTIELLKDKSILGFIIPNGILRTTTYDLVRKYILDNTKIIKIIDLGEGVFENVTASTVILILEKCKNNETRDANKIEILSNVKDLVNYDYTLYKIEQSSFYKNPSFTFNILINDNNLKINEKMEKNSIKLGSICKYISPGIDGNKDKYVIKKAINENYKPLLFGKDIDKYHINFNEHYILYDRKLLNRAREESIYSSEKIIMQRISGGSSPLTACIDRNKFYTFNSTNNIVLDINTDYKLTFILALINSRLLNWYYSNNYSNKSNLTVNISKTFLEQLPIPQATPEQQDSLAQKAEQMIELNKQLHQESKLALDLIIAEYQPKKISQKLEKFYTLGDNLFLEELKKQGVNMSLSQKEELIKWYNEKSGRLNDIQNKINKTDEMIDQEIYSIYNLMDEEIKIIEEV